ncbi:hypothetical protein [Glutamicibacter protophormiae]|uniref:hypothetical protein n=1 Tax=Glutamicibacter protophormiae TaxID=37930 RepID=UPI003A8FAF48
MSEQPKLDQFAVEATAKKLYNQYGKGNWGADWDQLHPRIRAEYIDKVEELVSEYFAAALPGLSGGPWSVTQIRTYFEWGGQVRLDPAEFDRVLANERAEALEEAADAMDADASVHDPLRLKSDWIRIRAAQLRQETETR